jgi:hypothetical protein
MAKQEGLFKQFWGKHCHVTEVLSWESPHGDLKRGAKFTRKSTNFNISMTGTDISGLLDLNDTIDVRDDNGTYICTFTGREVLCSFFKFSDGSPFIAAAHQLGPLSNVHIVHPNIPEGETLATSFQKQPAVFIKHHLLDQKVDEEFIRKFLDTFVDAQFIHDIQNCKWDSKTQTLLTKEEQEQDFQVTNLEAQAWYQDVIKQYEQVKDKEMRSKNYAAQEALFDLDEEMSTKTMHEKNDKKATMTGKEEVEVEDVSSDDEAEEVEWTKVRSGRRKGPTPNSSVEVQSDGDESDEEQSDDEDSSDDDSSTASAAGHLNDQAGKAG